MLSLILSLIVAGIAGWAAGNIMKSGGFGVIGNVLLGIVGGFVGRAMRRAAGAPPGLRSRWISVRG